MSVSAAAAANLEKLLKLARSDADALRIDLADVERAQTTAKASLATLDETTRREEAVIKETSGADFAAFFEGVRARRLNIQQTLMTLARAEEDARDKLEAAFIEIKKLEHLLEIYARELKKTAARADLHASDEAGMSKVRA